MGKGIENEIAGRDKMIASLEKEIRIQAELIMEQKAMIRTLEKHNAELQKLIGTILKA
ncbi:MAG: hypothetical protein K1W35_04985 [Lachnospiraceae bacterium]